MRRNRWLARAVLTPVLALLYSTAPAQIVGPPENGYVDSAVCATCHAKQAVTYRLTGMGRSFYRPNLSNQIENYARGLPYYHEASATYYGMAVRDGRYYQSQYQIGFDGKQTNFVEKQIDYVVGSGNHARTYLSRTPRDILIELPLAWYSEKGGYWAMNPGYDRPDQEGFNRPIEYSCLFCHNAYPNMASQPKGPGGEPVFAATLPEGIDCQRCHGPGRAHVQSAQNRQGANIRAAIVNPARLTPARQIEVCLQCHLETTSFALPNSLTRYERGLFSYRPGEPLADFRLDFDHAPGTGHADDFEIASSAYQLEKSACLLKSGDKLSCTTCHNPHDVRHGAEAAQHYNAVCRECHGAPLDRLVASSRHTSSADCIGCHMPKRRTDDAVHVVMTDHHIQRFKPARDLLADIPERTHAGAYQGEVVRYTPPSLASGDTPGKPGDELYLAEAQVIQRSNLEAGIPRLAAAIRKLQPEGADHYVALADALRISGQCEQAITTYAEALRHSPGEAAILQKMALCLATAGRYAEAEKAARDALAKAPSDPKLWTQIGLALLRQDKSQEAIAAFEKATAIDPDLFEAWNDLGELWLQNGEPARAEPALRSALRAQPNSVTVHTNLGDLLSSANRFDEAKYHFETALHYRPDDSSIHFRYALALARVRRYPDAQAQLEKSLQENPNDADAHHALGIALDAQRDLARATDEFREAVRLRPGFALANLNLGWELVKSGKPAEALPYLTAAAASSDARIQEKARSLMNR